MLVCCVAFNFERHIGFQSKLEGAHQTHTLGRYWKRFGNRHHVVVLQTLKTSLRCVGNTYQGHCITASTIAPDLLEETSCSFSSPSAPAHEFSLSRRFGQDCPVLFQGTFEQRNCDEKLKVKKRKKRNEIKNKVQFWKNDKIVR